MKRSILVALLGLGLAACGGGDGFTEGGRSQVAEVKVQRAFPRLSFTQPLFLTAAPDDRAHLYVVTWPGQVMVFDNIDDPATAASFLDIRDRVVDPVGEEGLIGMAFDPGFAVNRRFYVFYIPATGAHRSRLSRFTAPSATAADPASEVVLLEIPQGAFNNHKGGSLAFGPDGLLYVSSGDGGGVGDPENNAQDLGNLLGKILRVTTTGTAPPDNPFFGAGGGVREEIWAFGLRNPWRIGFDRATGALWTGDVGQDEREEIDRILPGRNYGWRIYEGTRSNLNPDGRPLSNFEPPVFEYPHASGNCSVTGGYVYRGAALPAQRGRYFFADFCSGRVSSLDAGSGPLDVRQIGEVVNPTSFGEDLDGELYITSFGGTIHKIVPR
ncbi:MAG TPA: PQQ-dependent sugar dehydrogenase [Solimonas sp.]|nr:PQQ-dependent sugar dehydrogenase [Solimonas sp.]